MKRTTTILKALAAAALSCAMLASCKPEEGEKIAKAVLSDQQVLSFSASKPAAQTVTVYSDGLWHTTAPEWIQVDPSEGSGTTTVTVTAQENVDAGGMLEPRKDTLIFGGKTLASRQIIIVSQEGDAYRKAEHLSLAKIAALADGKSFILDDATVAAGSTAGFVLTDGASALYVKSDKQMSVGDKVTVKGIKGTENGIPCVTQADEVMRKSSGAFDYPEPLDLNSVIAGYKADKMDYVTVSGTIAGGNLLVKTEDAEYSIKQVDCPSELSISSLGGHKVTLCGYMFGLLGSNLFGIITTALEDKGIDQLIYFEDDFEWLEPWVTASGAGDAITDNDPSSVAPNVFTSAACEGFVAAFMERGYGYFEGQKDLPWVEVTPDNAPPGKVLYLQKNYLKFGKTDWSSGITLPAMSAIKGSDNILLEFDWCWQVTGGYKPDLMTLTVEVVGNGTCAESGSELSVPLESAQSQVDGECAIEWQHASVKILGVDAATRIKLRPTNYDPTIENPARRQNRWYLDNIKVVPAEGGGSGPGGGLPAGTVLLNEDFEWLEPYATAANAPDDVASNSVGSSPNIFTTEALQPILNELMEKGYGYIWAGKGLEWSTATPDSGNGRTLYLQKNYLKFGKSDYSSGLILPAFAEITSSANLEVSFDWCWCMTGGSKPDIMTLSVVADDVTAEELHSTQPTEEDQTKLEWQHASVQVNGATGSTRITLRPTNADPYVSNTRGQNRWYLDNIKVVVK